MKNTCNNACHYSYFIETKDNKSIYNCKIDSKQRCFGEECSYPQQREVSRNRTRMILRTAIINLQNKDKEEK